MEKKKKVIWKKLIFGAGIGLINGVFGAGGGMLAVLALQKLFGMEQKNAHANALCIMLPLTLVSVTVYALKTDFELYPLPFVIPTFFIGAIIGARLLPKLSGRLVSLIFAALMIVSSIWLMF